MHSSSNKIIIPMTPMTHICYYVVIYYNHTNLPKTGTIIINNVQENFTSMFI